MDHFSLRDGVLHAEDVSLPQIAEAVDTPVYVYSRATLERHAQVFVEGLAALDAPLIAFAVKANPNLAVLKVLAQQGFGADVVSGGELARALAAGMPPERIVFSGVGKTRTEMQAALDAGIRQLNIESEEEGRELAELAAARGENARCVLRINPDIDAGTHDKITTGKADNKFGVPIARARELFDALAGLDGLALRGVAVHIGSQLASLDPLEAAFEKIGALVRELREAGHPIDTVDLGGGLGVPYKEGETYPSPAEYGAMVARVTEGWDVQLVFEPGRVIAGNAGVLLTRVIRVKRGVNHPFYVLDAAMNDLARPAMYGAWHDIVAVEPSGERTTANVVGPICETGDTFAMDREMDRLAAGDLAVLRTAGAYGATMASSYNSRGFVPEVLVDGEKFAVVAERLSAAAIMDAEPIPDWLD
ncbi:MAG: diaminopimelate decarboxylase [Sphingomonadales bacterium CG12_big_fil_rev_8_21_14_0_65_65_10]|uniref:Diaminopimelate decarboxylase n=1 Tax=Blastomonas marina TaxID=1867408 RepID=A0ABQ1F582_9SPHN|nr:diaminopimelate decarboxylase [Blastomonas marina]PIW56448.1 MAG: diaminopimelate decarboxylase [Sphingomonadales bacterium CG12_big_fil_rev_8_21_14_0_65_65_10]GFZ99205.1 diaminopimelate decarboxylase [Blastomonas marina]